MGVPISLKHPKILFLFNLCLRAQIHPPEICKFLSKFCLPSINVYHNRIWPKQLHEDVVHKTSDAIQTWVTIQWAPYYYIHKKKIKAAV
jgi:hypothetical protein